MSGGTTVIDQSNNHYFINSLWILKVYNFSPILLAIYKTVNIDLVYLLPSPPVLAQFAIQLCVEQALECYRESVKMDIISE